MRGNKISKPQITEGDDGDYTITWQGFEIWLPSWGDVHVTRDNTRPGFDSDRLYHHIKIDQKGRIADANTGGQLLLKHDVHDLENLLRQVAALRRLLNVQSDVTEALALLQP